MELGKVEEARGNPRLWGIAFGISRFGVSLKVGGGIAGFTDVWPESTKGSLFVTLGSLFLRKLHLGSMGWILFRVVKWILKRLCR